MSKDMEYMLELLENMVDESNKRFKTLSYLLKESLRID